MKQRSGSSSLSVLKLKSFSSLVKWCAAHYTRHMKCHVSLRDLYGLCVNARTDPGKSLAVWMNQNQTIPGQITGHIFRVFSGMAVWKRLMMCFTGKHSSAARVSAAVDLRSDVVVWSVLNRSSEPCTHRTSSTQNPKLSISREPEMWETVVLKKR